MDTEPSATGPSSVTPFSQAAAQQIRAAVADGVYVTCSPGGEHGHLIVDDAGVVYVSAGSRTAD